MALVMDTEKELIKRAIEAFGLTHQINKAIEELGELISAIARRNRSNIAEEIADVRIMCKQLEIIFEIDAEVFKAEKLERLAMMLGNKKNKYEDCNF